VRDGYFSTLGCVEFPKRGAGHGRLSYPVGKERPQLLGRPFDGPMEGHEPLLPPSLHHDDLRYPFTVSEDAPRFVEDPRH
jgi:hypothetical protein